MEVLQDLIVVRRRVRIIRDYERRLPQQAIRLLRIVERPGESRLAPGVPVSGRTRVAATMRLSRYNRARIAWP
jgi:hypothetical protein